MASIPDIDEAMFEEAVRWHLRLSESPDPALLGEHRSWLALDPQREAAMAEAVALFGALRLPAIDAASAEGSAPAVRTRPRRSRRWSRAAAAACVAIAASWTMSWLSLGGYDRLRADAATPVGELRALTLDDGSVVTLDSDSALAIRLRQDRRIIQLYRGRAHFDVAPDASRPFIVESDGTRAQALGTVFDVRQQAGRTQVEVFEGRVRIEAGNGSHDVLGAGRAAWLDASGIAGGTIVDMDASSAWQRGQLVFYRAPLSDVVTELSRYRRGSVLVHGDAARSRAVSGVFETGDPDAALAILQDTLQLRRLQLGPWLTVLY